jgi:hypothetical protein
MRVGLQIPIAGLRLTFLWNVSQRPRYAVERYERPQTGFGTLCGSRALFWLAVLVGCIICLSK